MGAVFWGLWIDCLMNLLSVTFVYLMNNMQKRTLPLTTKHAMHAKSKPVVASPLLNACMGYWARTAKQQILPLLVYSICWVFELHVAGPPVQNPLRTKPVQFCCRFSDTFVLLIRRCLEFKYWKKKLRWINIFIITKLRVCLIIHFNFGFFFY